MGLLGYQKLLKCAKIYRFERHIPNISTVELPDSHIGEGLGLVWPVMMMMMMMVMVMVMCSCLNDYVDVYTQARSELDDLLSVPLHGRYCGADKEKLPNLIISMTNVLVIGLYTVKTDDSDLKRFKANYRFIDDCT